MFFQIYCMFSEQIACSSNSWFVCFLLTFRHMFSIFDKAESIRIHRSSCVSYEVVFSLSNTRTNTTKNLSWLQRVKSTDSSNSMCSKRFMMKRFCIEKCQNRANIHSDLHSEQFHEIDWFKSISKSSFSRNVCNYFCSKVLFVRSKRQWSELIAV